MKRKRTAAEKRARRERKKNTRIIFINGKQKRVPREPMIDGLSVDEFIARNADPIWLHQNEMWELMEPEEEFMPATIQAPKAMVETVAGLRFPPPVVRHVQALIDRYNQGNLPPQEREELAALVELSEALAMVRAEASNLLIQFADGEALF